MLKPILKNPYAIGGIIVFLILFFIGIFALETSVWESALYSAILTAIGIVVFWWKENIW
jgi:hypothetical protein